MPSDWSDDIPPFMLVGNPLGGFIDLGTDVPAVIDAYYLAKYAVTVNQCWIGMYADSNDYRYMITAVGGLGIGAQFGCGWVSSGVVREMLFDYYDGTQLQVNYGNNDNQEFQIVNGKLLLGNGDPTNAYFDFAINAVSQSRGVVHWEQITSTFTSAASATEQLAYTSASFTIPNGRVFDVELQWCVESAATQSAIVNIRENNLAGTLLLTGPRHVITNTGQNIPFYKKGLIQNNTGSAKTIQLAITVTPSAATIVQMQGSAVPNASFIQVTDYCANNIVNPVSVT